MVNWQSLSGRRFPALLILSWTELCRLLRVCGKCCLWRILFSHSQAEIPWCEFFCKHATSARSFPLLTSFTDRQSLLPHLSLTRQTLSPHRTPLALISILASSFSQREPPLNHLSFKRVLTYLLLADSLFVHVDTTRFIFVALLICTWFRYFIQETDQPCPFQLCVRNYT
jgi:hypothetical protein